MDEEDTKQCPNCKREIPSINFTTHSVHCARNLRNCPVCKEPVPVAQLQEHHDALHKEVPCKKCGESVCGTDLEDHIRDSCAQTIKPCRYCELELPRHALPPHESYCGARSEQCPECKEYVMIKYRQLHLDSNHGFIRLSDGSYNKCFPRYCELELPRHALPPHESYCGARSEQCPECKEYVMIKYRQLHLDSNHGFIRLSDGSYNKCFPRYCELELPRHALPPHESYCGARSKQCPECKEYVMIKYRQLHLDSNHGFIRLSDGSYNKCFPRYCELELPRHALPPHESYCGARSEQCPECKEYVMIKYRQLHLDSNQGFIRLSDGSYNKCFPRYCELELPRHALPPHESYCGARSEQCPECKEYVMIKYRQLHLDSNHGFIRLSDGSYNKCFPRYCELELPRHALPPHESYCGARSEQCPECKEYVMIKYRQLHLDSNHGFIRLSDGSYNKCFPRYCELELPRHALPPHESYCGARSEQCPECKEYVMIKYRQLHLDSNHGFIRLSDDPVPIEIKAKSKPITNGIANPSTSRQNEPNRARPQTEIPQTTRSDLKTKPQTEIRFPGSSQDNRGVVNGVNGGRNIEQRASDSSRNERAVDRVSNVGTSGDRSGRVTVKRTNDQPQINTSVEPREKVHKELATRGAVKKRPAPQPPAAPARDLPYWSAQKRAQDEEQKRQEQNAYNLSVGLPPVLSPAAKLDKLRKMDALHNRELEEDYSHKLRGRVWQPTEPEGHRLGGETDGQIDDLSHLRPMTAQQFMDSVKNMTSFVKWTLSTTESWKRTTVTSCEVEYGNPQSLKDID
ncbi:uncharacterized protein LOC134800351 [Cydia splendana]|uniref:uncharacterized protein LOC134800351 n=1 Tax=Cydia splendana TaxID=1100963 RepID=UPI00300D6689